MISKEDWLERRRQVLDGHIELEYAYEFYKRTKPSGYKDLTIEEFAPLFQMYLGHRLPFDRMKFLNFWDRELGVTKVLKDNIEINAL